MQFLMSLILLIDFLFVIFTFRLLYAKALSQSMISYPPVFLICQQFHEVRMLHVRKVTIH